MKRLSILNFRAYVSQFCLMVWCLFCIGSAFADVSIKVKEGLINKNFSGRVYVVIAPKNKKTMPLQTSYWFKPIEIISKELKNWDGQSTITINRNDTHYIKETTFDNTTFELQVLFRINVRDAEPFSSLGNVYSDPISLSKSEHQDLDISVTVDKIISEQSPLYKSKPLESEQLKLFSHQSELLSKFHKQSYSVDVAVRLPKDWATQSDKKWPVLYSISGMGGNEVGFLRQVKGREKYFDKMITVSVNAMNYGGHSVFVDSANTGPWASMLLEEIIPYIDSNYHGAGAEQRYLTGASSGGWSSLWLQVKYPKDFSGVWSFVPDPVDFRDFQRINLYSSNQNIYVNDLGEDRLIGRSTSGKKMIRSRDFNQLEQALGEGGQIKSFEYVFSPKGEDGMPMPLFDRQTGRINRQVVEAWKPYDIRLYLKNNWLFIKDDLKDKLHVYAGEKDNFFLEGAVRLLKEEFAYMDAEADAEIEIIPSMSHSIDPEKFKKMLTQIID